MGTEPRPAPSEAGYTQLTRRDGEGAEPAEVRAGPALKETQARRWEQDPAQWSWAASGGERSQSEITVRPRETGRGRDSGRSTDRERSIIEAQQEAQYTQNPGDIL